jgi:hypothetical protein
MQGNSGKIWQGTLVSAYNKAETSNENKETILWNQEVKPDRTKP